MSAIPASNPLRIISDSLADLVARAAPSVVAVQGASRAGASGFLWRPGLVVTASEALETDEGIRILLANGNSLPAELVGRDASSDVALLRAEDAGTPSVELGEAETIRPGELAVAVGRRTEGPIAGVGAIAVSGGPWTSMRGGRIDRFLRCDLRLDPRGEGGVLLNAEGHALGMAVFGPRRSVLAIPAETIERVAGQLLAHGRIPRGYLGLGLQPIRIDESVAKGQSLAEPRGVLVVSLDPAGPAKQAGMLVGDIILTWNGDPVPTVREIFLRLGSGTIGKPVELALIRAGEPAQARVVVGESTSP